MYVLWGLLLGRREEMCSTATTQVSDVSAFMYVELITFVQEKLDQF